MQIACGTDIIEISRIKESIESSNGKFLEKVYTENEIKYCESKNEQKYQHYAARFAAKEATFKALSIYLEENYVEWKNIEVLNDESGRPSINFVNKELEEIESIDISLSHCKGYAVANVVALFKNY